MARELEKEIELYIDKNCEQWETEEFSVDEITKIAILDFAEPREKRIAELEAYNEKLLNGDIEKHNKIVELEAQIEKMKDGLNKWYNQHNTDDYTETFYDSLLRDTEKYLWGDSVNDL